MIRIIPYADEHAGAFYRLNRAWLDLHGLYEAPDERQLADPRGTILDRGGSIFVALDDRDVVGTAAVVPCGAAMFEIVKLTVASHARGQGLGRRLAECCLDEARALGATRVALVSSTRLDAALRLYESLGFRHAEPPRPLGYATADVYMELDLSGPRTAPPAAT